MRRNKCTLIVRSAEPVQNHSLPGSNAIDRTHPKCPLITYKHHPQQHAQINSVISARQKKEIHIMTSICGEDALLATYYTHRVKVYSFACPLK
jgi:hypothetical protein